MPHSDLPLYHAKTLAGLESLVERELREHGAQVLRVGRRGIDFGADMETLFRVCMCSRFTLRVLRPILQFEAQDAQDLYEQANTWDWMSVMDAKSTFAIDATVYSDLFTHSQYATLRLKDAIVDHFRTIGGLRPSVDRERPDVRIHLHIAGSQVTVSLDAAGEPLSRRGYRPQNAPAPLNEVLAAGLLALAGWKPGIPLYDPMCGSGTFVTEAALWCDGYPVNWHRRRYAFMNWRGYDDDAFFDVRAQLKARVTPVATPIFASDKDFGAVSMTRQSLVNMEVEDHVELGRADFFKMTPRTETGIVVMNPPYGERMAVADLAQLYKDIGDRLKSTWTGFDAWIISSDLDALKHVGLKHHDRVTVYNGPLECRWQGYAMR